MTELWYPPALRAPLPDAGPYVGGPWRGVLHSTEGQSFSGAWAAYKASGNAPHFTASYEGGKFKMWQHIPLDRAATAMRNLPGGVETNRLSAVQLEIVGLAAEAPLWPTPLLTGIRDWMIWCETQTGIKANAPAFLPYPASYGSTPVRMTFDAWRRWDGWCGHQHVPENVHGDPGALDIVYLLERTPKEVKAMYEPPIGPIAAAWLDETGKVISAASPDGAVFWGKWYGNVAGKPYWGTRKVATIGARPDGQPGYRITATTASGGGYYDLPDGLDKL